MSETPLETQQEPLGRPLPPLWRRFIDVFFSPGDLFERLADNPKWLATVILGGVLIALGAFLIPVELYADMMRAQFLERGQEIPGDPERMATFGRIGGTVFGLVSYTLISLIVAGFLTLTLAFILGDRGRFVQYFAATTHAFLIYAVAQLAMTPVKIAAADIQLILSPGNALRGVLPDGYFLNVLSTLDVFAIWAYAVLAIAATRIDPKRGFGSAFAILMVLAVGFGMIGALFM